MSRGLSIRGLTKRYPTHGEGITVVSDVSFDVGNGEFFTMLGPSGCGKTTTLRMIAGLEEASSGAILIDGQDTTNVPARRRNVGMVFQSYALFPHLPVFENVAYGLRIRNLPETEIRAKVGEILDLLALSPLADRLPGQLSGGQQQRVSIARALVYRPPVLLLDEPLANLDAKLRVQMRDEIRRIQRALGIMVLYVTHDQEEAMAVSDRIAVFERGRVAQIGSPTEIYDTPASHFVADFIGKANFLPVRINKGNPVSCHFPSGNPITPGRVIALPHQEHKMIPAGFDGLLMVRPERLTPTDGPAAIAGRVERLQHLGAMTRCFVSVVGMDCELLVDLPRITRSRLREGDPCKFDVASSDVALFSKAREMQA
ncbi:ABC transporter ATP-binding protein [Microvirga alba]|uniref:ABC transporter ATP-binding protein n=1 Tax=Microvirga alba TaxID=2791025 RepID=A0A931FRG7_9HYPH|nr:ABC transporter ATP-binding protein [Microvirga alba]MBF9235762.1 ABC transporter ATP-binding protein [Microvirga alba]